jgi:hypothetical protein
VSSFVYGAAEVWTAQLLQDRMTGFGAGRTLAEADCKFKIERVRSFDFQHAQFPTQTFALSGSCRSS